jgi:hypothetical protein
MRTPAGVEEIEIVKVEYVWPRNTWLVAVRRRFDVSGLHLLKHERDECPDEYGRGYHLGGGALPRQERYENHEQSQPCESQRSPISPDVKHADRHKEPDQQPQEVGGPSRILEKLHECYLSP